MDRRLVIVLVLALASCSSTDDFTPTGPGGSTIPTIGGTYSATDMWRFDLTLPDEQNAFACDGGITINSQVGNDFSGTFFIRDNSCGSRTGSVTDGALQTNGAVSFALTVPGTDPNFITAVFGCTYVSGDRVLTGTLIGNQLEAEARTVMDCGSAGQVTVVLRLAGSK